MTNDPIIVTAATGGIGSSVAKELASRGHSLILAVRNLDKARLLAAELLKLGAKDVRSIHFDFEDSTTIQAISNLVSSCKGLVLCPPRIQPTADPLPENEKWLKVYNQIFLQPLGLIKAIVPALIHHASDSDNRASVVLISGISSKQAMGNYAINNSIRAGWQAQIKTLANSFGPSGVAFNSVSLEGVLTAAYREKIEAKSVRVGHTFEEQMELEVSNVPLRRYAQPDDVGKAVTDVLLSMSIHMTGQNIVLDGGFIQTY